MSATQTRTAQLSPNVHSFLTRPVRYATIATINPDGSPHQIVIWFLLRDDDERGVHLVVNSRRGRRWPTNLERDARANLAVYDADNAVTIECHVEQTYTGESAQADIAEMAMRYDGPDMAQVGIARFRTEDRVSFILRPDRFIVHGDPS